MHTSHSMAYTVGVILQDTGFTKRSALCYNRMTKIRDIEKVEDEH